MEQIKVGIVGYGNLGRGVELALQKATDMKLIAIVTRRDPFAIKPLSPATQVFPMSELMLLRGKVDVMILCGGSATDLPVQGPQVAEMFNTVDSFDNHTNIPAYYESMHKANIAYGTSSAISIGWDPGLFSVARTLFNSILPTGIDYTFWGRGVSQGHSDAIRRIPGVLDAKQYTVPVAEVLNEVRKGATKEYTARQKHTRECYVVADPKADRKRIEHDIVSMPNYFEPYDTVVNFVTEQEFKKNHSKMPHAGFVIRNGETSPGVKERIELSLELDSNPEFTSSILVAYARAVARLTQKNKGETYTSLDIAPALLSPLSGEELRAKLV